MGRTMYYCTSGNHAGTQGLSDEEVVGRVRAGETSLYEILVHRHHQRLYSLSLRVLGNDAEAEDATQEVHLKAFTRLDQFAARSSFAKWLNAIAVNEALARLRTRRRRPFLDIADFGTDKAALVLRSHDDDPEKKAIASEATARVSKALAMLPKPYRVVFITRELDEMSTAETAGRLGVTDECVKTRLYRAKGLLRRKYVKVRRTSYRSSVYTC